MEEEKFVYAEKLEGEIIEHMNKTPDNVIAKELREEFQQLIELKNKYFSESMENAMALDKLRKAIANKFISDNLKY